VRLKKHTVWFLAISLVFGLTSNIPFKANATELDKCRIAASKNSTVSLGFPVPDQRLKGDPKILVIPFKLKDTPYVFTDKEKIAAIEGAKIIQKISSNKSNPVIVFATLQEIDLVKKNLVDIKINQQNGYQKQDEANSTWGFIRRVINEADTSVDFKDIDAVIVQGPTSTDSDWVSKSAIAEAMMFSKDGRDPFFRPINTAEGTIYNASLITTAYLESSTTYAHEIMHLYGLTDLYGSGTSPTFFSLMAGQNHRLLAHEKWVLGWLPDSQVVCLNGVSSSDLLTQVTEIKFKNDNADQLVVINQNKTDEAIIIEKVSFINEQTKGTDSYLAFYNLKNEDRPPIEMIPVSGVTFNVLTYYNGAPSTRFIGSVLKSLNYDLLISNVDTQGISFHLIPKSQSDKLASLQSKALSVQREAEVKVQAEVEAKAKEIAEAEAKAKLEAEAKAKLEAEARAKVAPKIKSITCVKSKTIRTVKSLNPKCPKGFKQR